MPCNCDFCLVQASMGEVPAAEEISELRAEVERLTRENAALVDDIATLSDNWRDEKKSLAARAEKAETEERQQKERADRAMDALRRARKGVGDSDTKWIDEVLDATD